MDLSKYMNRELMEQMLCGGIGFDIVERKDSPKVAFWVLRKRKRDTMNVKDKKKKRNSGVGVGGGGGNNDYDWKEEWSTLRVLYKAKKYRNDFGVVLSKDDCR